MFLGSTQHELEARVLRSGRRFRSEKRRKTEEGRQNPSLFEESEHDIFSYLDKRYCDEEENYSLILEGEEESEESMETPRSGRDYITPGVSLEEKCRASYLERVFNTDSASTATSM